jgi:hypothetical protein
MNLFELNARLAVKLGQSFETLYNLEYFEYSMLINIVKKDIEEQSNPTEPVNELDSQVPLMVNLPENLRLK